MSDTNKWADTFFTEPGWITLHLAYRSYESAVCEVDLIETLLDLPKGASIVDIPCGPGDHSIELGERGYAVTGVDMSEKILEIAKSRAADYDIPRDHRPRFLQGDMRSIKLDSQYDAVLCMWGSFGYFDLPGDVEQLNTIHDLLKPGGKAIMEFLPLEALLLHYLGHDSIELGDLVISQVRTYNAPQQSIESVWEFSKEGEPKVTRKTSVRLYTVREILKMFGEAGFKDVEFINPETTEKDAEKYTVWASRTWVRATRA